MIARCAPIDAQMLAVSKRQLVGADAATGNHVTAAAAPNLLLPANHLFFAAIWTRL
jgi:hypothetical protein